MFLFQIDKINLQNNCRHVKRVFDENLVIAQMQLKINKMHKSKNKILTFKCITKITNKQVDGSSEVRSSKNKVIL